MWTEITRPQYQRGGLRYASDTTDGEWAVIAALMPPPHKGRGRRRTTPLRAVVNAIFYIAQSGCQWRMLPKDFPPFTTVQQQQGQNDGHRYLVCSRGWGRKIGCDRLNRGTARRFRRRPISGSVAACRRLPILMVCPLPR